MGKIHKGNYGTEDVARVPVIAGGSGSITSFNLTVNRKFTYKGKSQSYLSARCPTGHYFTGVSASFKDGTSLKGTVVRPCTPKG
jgi:hypothetical protein